MATTYIIDSLSIATQGFITNAIIPGEPITISTLGWIVPEEVIVTRIGGYRVQFIWDGHVVKLEGIPALNVDADDTEQLKTVRPMKVVLR